MSSRDAILSAVRQSLPVARSLPEIMFGGGPSEVRRGRELVRQFIDAAAATGASVVRTPPGGAMDAVDRLYVGAGRRVSVLAGGGPIAVPHSFADTGVFICSAALGVAENGAVWLPISRLRYRAAVFLATNVIVVLEAATVVPDFHLAYESIGLASESFGVFVAGPSKTADIEQALVVGAHGPKSLTIVLIDDP